VDTPWQPPHQPQPSSPLASSSLPTATGSSDTRIGATSADPRHEHDDEEYQQGLTPPYTASVGYQDLGSGSQFIGGFSSGHIPHDLAGGSQFIAGSSSGHVPLDPGGGSQFVAGSSFEAWDPWPREVIGAS
jgi:hypothetical protein